MWRTTLAAKSELDAHDAAFMEDHITYVDRWKCKSVHAAVLAGLVVIEANLLRNSLDARFSVARLNAAAELRHTHSGSYV